MKKRLLIATPSAYNVFPEYVKGIVDAIQEAKKVLDVDIDYRFIRGYMVDMSRNQLSFDAIKGGYDYILFVDSDTIIPSDAIVKLLPFAIKEKVGIVAGWQRRKRNYEGIIETYELTPNKDFDKNLKEEEIIDYNHPFEVKGVGFGCTLVDIEILKALFDSGIPPFKYVKYADGSALSEDLYFCYNVKNAMNEKIYVHPHVRCSHIWSDIY